MMMNRMRTVRGQVALAALFLAPDIRVEQTEADRANGRDKQLEFAIEFLNQGSSL